MTHDTTAPATESGPANSDPRHAHREWWGTYPAAGLGTPTGMGEGIHVFRPGRRPVTAVVLPAPAFLAVHPTLPVLYSVTETDASELVAFDISEDVPREIGRVATGGDTACHVLLTPDAAHAIVSHYGSGHVADIALGSDGTPTELLLSHVDPGTGANAERQDGPHAHYCAFEPLTGVVLCADLGTDRIRRYRLADGVFRFDGIAAQLPAGSGARHIVCAGDLLYIGGELTNELATVRWDRASATGEVIDMTPSTTVAPRSTDESTVSHIALVDGVLLLGTRGADVIALFDISPEGQLRYRCSLDAGHWPRHFAAIGDELVIAAERGHEVRRHRLADVLALPPEAELGVPHRLPVKTDQIPSPACIVRG